MRNGAQISGWLAGVALAGALGLLVATVVSAVGVDAGAPPPEGPAAEDRPLATEEPLSAETPGRDAGERNRAARADVRAAEDGEAQALGPDGEVVPGARSRDRGRSSARAGDGVEGTRLRAADAWSATEGALAAWDDPLVRAVDNDPFNPERRPPARRYRLPTERGPVAREEPRERPEAPDFRVVGSVMAGEHGVALVQLDRNPPRLLALGESLGGYRLDAVDGDGATLVGPAGNLRYPVMEPLAPRDDDDDDRRRRGRDDERRAREAEQRARQLQEALQRFRTNVRLRGGGVSPDGRVLVPVPDVRVVPGGGGGEVPLPDGPWIPSPAPSGDEAPLPPTSP